MLDTWQALRKGIPGDTAFVKTSNLCDKMTHRRQGYLSRASAAERRDRAPAPAREMPMPRYYFNLFDGSDMFDEEGTELSGVKEMRLYMLTMALEVMKKEENWKETWQMEALDEQGKIIGTLDFGLDQRLSKRS